MNPRLIVPVSFLFVLLAMPQRSPAPIVEESPKPEATTKPRPKSVTQPKPAPNSAVKPKPTPISYAGVWQTNSM
jgi:hypothetical protein